MQELIRGFFPVNGLEIFLTSQAEKEGFFNENSQKTHSGELPYPPKVAEFVAFRLGIFAGILSRFLRKKEVGIRLISGRGNSFFGAQLFVDSAELSGEDRKPAERFLLTPDLTIAVEALFSGLKIGEVRPKNGLVLIAQDGEGSEHLAYLSAQGVGASAAEANLLGAASSSFFRQFLNFSLKLGSKSRRDYLDEFRKTKKIFFEILAKTSKFDGEENLVVDCEGAVSFEMVSELLSTEELSLLRLKVVNSCDPSDEDQSKSVVFETDSVGVRLGKNGDTFSLFEARDKKVTLLDAGKISAIFVVFFDRFLGLKMGSEFPPVRLVSDRPFDEDLKRFAEQEGAKCQVSNFESQKKSETSGEISIFFDGIGRCRFEFSDDFLQKVGRSKDVDFKNVVVLAERARLGASPVLLLFFLVVRRVLKLKISEDANLFF